VASHGIERKHWVGLGILGGTICLGFQFHLHLCLQSLVFWMQGSGCRAQGAGRRVQGAGCRAQGAGRRVQGAGCRVQGEGLENLG